VRRAVAQRVRQRIGQDEAALGVGVHDLDGLAVGADDHVAWSLRGRPRHVFGRRDDRHDIERQLTGGDDVDGREHGRCPGHVVLHPAHVLGVLERDAAAVEGDSFADQGEDRDVFGRSLAPADWGRHAARATLPTR